MAGIIGALDNAIGSVGVVPGARLWSVQVVGPNERNVSNLLGGMDYVAQHANEIAVVNASVSVPAGSSYQALHHAVQSIVNRGVIF